MSEHPRPVPVALTIAGSDSGGGAGLQADLKTFSALGVYGMTAITAITAQNTTAILHAEVLSPELVVAQIDAVMADIGCDAAKTGMLANADLVAAVADCVRRHHIPNLVVDPVMVAKSGYALLAEQAREVLMSELLPLATVVTPNLHEACALVGREVRSIEDMGDAAREIASRGPAAVVVKGGHLEGSPVDVVYLTAEDRELHLTGEMFDTRNTHGTGCTFSAAIAALLATGRHALEAIRGAKRFISLAIEHSLDLGAGHGPTNHIEAGRRFRMGG